MTDITYIRTWQGWRYLAVVMDLFSRKIVGCLCVRNQDTLQVYDIKSPATP